MARFDQYLRLFISVFITHCFVFLSIQAGVPTEQVRDSTNKLLAVFEDPYFSEESRSNERRERIIEVADERIDWYALCRSCLGRHWTKRTKEEKKEFINLLSAFLQYNYANLIIDNFTNLKEIKYLKERVDERFAFVRIEIIDEEDVVYPMGYRLIKKSDSDDWEVIDINIEGVGMVKNYRIQFDDIIRKSSFDELIQKLRSRIEKLDLE